mgnify:CR=1 FL=1
METLIPWILFLLCISQATVIYWLLQRLTISKVRCEDATHLADEWKNEKLRLEIEHADETQRMEADFEQNLEQVEKEAKKQKGRAQSAHTSKGQIVEKWCPFIDHPDIDPDWASENWNFLGNPLDYIVWHWFANKEQNLEEGKIILMDVKAANSKLTTKQRRIRDLITNGKVEWKEIRLN